MEIRLYKEQYRQEWDNFIRHSKNGTFLFCRDFMEYHSHRFTDRSYMFYENDILIAVIAGNVEDKIYYSHKGLSYGGLIMNSQTTAVQVLDIFNILTTELKTIGIQEIVYKAVPHIYHRMPAEEDLYALFRNNAVLTERYISSAILLSNKIAYSRTRKNGLKKAEKNGLEVKTSDDLESFWQILSDNLSGKYETEPVHSLSEISYLKQKFPDEIHLFSVSDKDGKMIAGCIVFDMPGIIHLQYTAGTEEGKKSGAIDSLIDHIINKAFPDKIYFDYGNSNEQQGRYLNNKLIYQKEGFGARAIVYDVYTINI